MKRHIAIIVMVAMVLTIMSTLASCGSECTHALKKIEAAESTCTQKGNDEYYVCTECGDIFSDAAATTPITEPVTYDRSEHVDEDKNHKCDVCDAITVAHTPAEGKHTCGHCGMVIAACVDADTDHVCDICGESVGTHDDSAGSHYCAYCGEKVSECADTDDHLCDVCGATLSACADADTDHACDVCGAEMGEHVSSEGGHNCDYCGGPVSECVDEDTDHVCDIGGCTVGEHVEGWGHTCMYCWQDVSGCYDNDKDHYCDICFNKMGVHKPPVYGHACEYCGYKYSECEAGEDDGDCSTPVYCIKCPEIVIDAIAHDLLWFYDADGHYCECQNDGCDYKTAKVAHTDESVCTCECGYAFTPKCDACGKCVDPNCTACESKCAFIDMNKVISFVPNANLAGPEGPDGQSNGYGDASASLKTSQIVVDGKNALLVTAPNGVSANSGASFKNNDAGTITSYGQAGYNCGMSVDPNEIRPLRYHFTNKGDTTVSFKYSNICYYYEYGSTDEITLAPGESTSVYIAFHYNCVKGHGLGVGSNSQIIFTKDAAAGAAVSIWAEYVVNDLVTSVSIATPATKLNFVAGETFTAEGLVLKANGHYQDRVYIADNYKTNLDGYTFTAADAGTKAVIVEFNGMLTWYIIEVSDHVHNVEYVAKVDPIACQKDGFEAHYACTICGEYFTDATGNTTAGAPKAISCHTPGDESNVLPGADIKCTGCGAVAGQRSMENWVLFNLPTTTNSIGSNIVNGKVEKTTINGILATKFSFGAGTIGATGNSAFQLKMSSNDGKVQTTIPHVADSKYKRELILYYENYSDGYVEMNLQNDQGYNASRVKMQANSSQILHFNATYVGTGSNWYMYYVDCHPTFDVSFAMYGYIYVNDGETDAPTIADPAKKLTYKVGETFSSDGLALNAKITNISQTLYASTGFTTNYDGRVFTADDIGTHTVTVSFAGKTVTYNINVVGEEPQCNQGIHEYAFKNDQSLFVEMNGSDAMYKKVCIHCGAASTEAYAAGKVAFVPHNRGLDGGHTIEYVTLEDGQIAAKLTFNSDVAAGWKTTIEASGEISGTNVIFPVPTEGRRLYMEMTSSADIKLTWQQEFYGDRDPFTFNLKAGETQGLGQFVKYTGSNTSSNLPYQEIVAESAIPAGTVVYFTGYFYDLTDVSALSIYFPATTTLFKVGETFSSAGLILKPASASSLFNNVVIYNPVTNLDGYTFKAEDAGKIIDVVVYCGNATTTYKILVIE